MLTIPFTPKIQLPPGYRVAWYSCHEHYQATGPDEWESAISVNPYDCVAMAFSQAGLPVPDLTNIPCFACAGEGRMQVYDDDDGYEDEHEYETCESCDGCGRVLEKETEPC